MVSLVDEIRKPGVYHPQDKLKHEIGKNFRNVAFRAEDIPWRGGTPMAPPAGNRRPAKQHEQDESVCDSDYAEYGEPRPPADRFGRPASEPAAESQSERRSSAVDADRPGTCSS